MPSYQINKTQEAMLKNKQVQSYSSEELSEVENNQRNKVKSSDFTAIFLKIAFLQVFTFSNSILTNPFSKSIKKPVRKQREKSVLQKIFITTLHDT